MSHIGMSVSPCDRDIGMSVPPCDRDIGMSVSYRYECLTL